MAVLSPGRLKAARRGNANSAARLRSMFEAKAKPRSRSQGSGPPPPIQPDRGQKADTLRQSLAALSFGHQTGGYNIDGQQSLAERVTPGFLESLNRNTRMELANVPVVEASVPGGQGAQVQPRPGASMLERLRFSGLGPDRAQVGTSDLNYPAELFSHEASHILGSMNPGAARTIEQSLSPEDRRHARESYLGGHEGARRILGQIASNNPVSSALSALGIDHRSEVFAEAAAHMPPHAILAGRQDPELRNALLQFYNEKALDPAAARGLQRDSEGRIMLAPPGSAP